MESNELAEAIAGMNFAMTAALRAIIRTHPDQAALKAAMEFEHQSALAQVTASPMADRTLEALHLFWGSLVLDPSET